MESFPKTGLEISAQEVEGCDGKNDLKQGNNNHSVRQAVDCCCAVSTSSYSKPEIEELDSFSSMGQRNRGCLLKQSAAD